MGFGGWGRRLVARESGERRVAAGGRRRRDAAAEVGTAVRVEEVLSLAAEVESVAVGRRWLRNLLEREFGQGHPQVDDALQALSEVLTNAVLYGTGPHVRLTCTVDGDGAEVAVHNDGRAGGVRRLRFA